VSILQQPIRCSKYLSHAHPRKSNKKGHLAMA